jgi:predicted acylesterase/phospholipase RssA
LNTKTDFQRALVFQGGGSLGAYEAGAYRALYELLSERDNKIGRQGKPLFDIVAGTSIGAMNAAVLVSYVKENKSWHGSAERLNEFWEILQQNPLLIKYQGLMNGGIIATILIMIWPPVNRLEDIIAQSSLCLKAYLRCSVLLKRLKIDGSLILLTHGIFIATSC